MPDDVGVYPVRASGQAPSPPVNSSELMPPGQSEILQGTIEAEIKPLD